ncbi:hypothetical protein D3C81_645200 [compost metagenome]
MFLTHCFQVLSSGFVQQSLSKSAVVRQAFDVDAFLLKPADIIRQVDTDFHLVLSTQLFLGPLQYHLWVEITALVSHREVAFIATVRSDRYSENMANSSSPARASFQQLRIPGLSVKRNCFCPTQVREVVWRRPTSLRNRWSRTALGFNDLFVRQPEK